MKKNVKNLPEFMALIKRYETITLQEIEEGWEGFPYWDAHGVAQHLTGFGGSRSCTLCRAVGPINTTYGSSQDCLSCVYPRSYGCLNHKSYDMIDNAQSPEELLTAYRERAKYMRTLV